MMINPFTEVMSLLKAGKNPQAAIRQMAMSNPQVAQAVRMFDGKTPAQLKQMAQNMAAERGTTVEDVARQLGITIPSER